MGSVPAAEALPWHFRGRRYAFTAFQMLLKWFQLEEATDVLLVGDSTGGAGMTQVMDDLHAMVHASLSQSMLWLSVLVPATVVVLSTMGHLLSTIN